MPATLKTHSVGATLVLTISHPGCRNALSPDIYAAGVEALNAADSQPDIRSVVITGEGADFCAGGDIRRLLSNRQQSPDVQAESIEQLHGWIETVRSFSKPVVGAVEGACAGAGFSLALACDFLVAARNSVFVMAYANVALSPDGGGSWSLTRQLPRATAMQLLMLGERIEADRLHQLGLVNHLTEPRQALARALEVCEALNAKAPNTLASIKNLINEAPRHTLNTHLKCERDQFVRNLHHPNAGEGLLAFLDKRPPRFH
jgi:enoyl-CoA hydratase/carnithine racemase